MPVRTMNLKPLLPAFLLSASLFYGCSASEVTVTEENAPNDLMKSVAALSAESTASEVQEVIETLINNTAEATDYQLYYNVKNEYSSLDLDDDNNLTSSDTTVEYIDNRVAMDDVYYELLEQESDGSLTAGQLKTDASGQYLVYSTGENGTIGKFDTDLEIYQVSDQRGEEETSDMDQVAKNSVVYPLYSCFGNSLYVSPAVNPEYFDFTLTKKGTTYTFAITVSDYETYNTAVDEAVESYYGVERTDLYGDGSYVAEINTTTHISITVTMDEDGVISKIVSESTDQIGNEEEPLDFISNQTVELSKVSDTVLDFLPAFIEKVQNGDLASGDVYTIAEIADGSTSSEDAEDKDSADSETADKETDDSKDESKEDESEAETSDADASEKEESKADDSEKEESKEETEEAKD